MCGIEEEKLIKFYSEEGHAGVLSQNLFQFRFKILFYTINRRQSVCVCGHQIRSWLHALYTSLLKINKFKI